MSTIVITGASRGIGAATALLAAEHGYDVVINYLKNRQAAEEIAECISQKGRKVRSIQADMSNEKDILKMFSEIDQHFGTIDVLVNNIGILEQQTSLERIDQNRLERLFSTNVFGVFHCSREAIKRMSKKNGGKGGSIVNVSSIAAKTGAPNEYIDYAATKGAIDSFTIGLSKEIADEGIRVNAVRPGFIYTDIHALGGEPDRIERLKSCIPLQRGGTALEVAEAILFLASDKASYITGTFIDIAGGR